jgi:hypothetical protein
LYITRESYSDYSDVKFTTRNSETYSTIHSNLEISIFLQQLELKYENEPQKIPDYSIDDQKYQGRTRIPEKGVAKAQPSHLEVMLGDAPPKSDTPSGSRVH